MKLLEVVSLFLRLGFTAFGGPAAHIAMYHDEVVRRRKWLSEQQFLDLLGATNLIPGPNSTEMVIHISYLRAGWPGLILGGLSFILPAVLIVLSLAWLYERYGSLPAAEWLLWGIKPVVIAIIMQALWILGKKAIRSPLTAAAGLIVLVLYFFHINEVLLLFLGGISVMLLENANRLAKKGEVLTLLPFLGMSVPAAAAPFQLSTLFFIFLKIGSVLYGSGYVLLAFLRSDLVERMGWLTDQQLLDAIAIGQVTPGPLFTSATFIGYQLGGLSGAILATLGIFLPSFVFVALSNPLIPRLRNSPWAASLLDGVNAVAVGLMAAVTIQLGFSVFIEPVSIMIALAAAILLIRFKVNTTWLIAGGIALGILRAVFFS